MAEASAETGKPTPDPTVLTTEALQREVAALKELQELRTEAIAEKFEERVHGIERMFWEKVAGMISVREEEFAGVQSKFDLVEQGRVEQKQDTKAAVDAALTAQKEAVAEQTTASERSIAKSEATFTKSIEEQAKTFSTAIEGQTRDMGQLRERIQAMESEKRGGEQVQTQRGASIAQIVAIVSTGLLLVSVVLAIVLAAASGGM